jgi:hypothetical protein
VRRFSVTHLSRFVVEIKTISLKIRRLLEVLFVSSSVVISDFAQNPRPRHFECNGDFCSI